MYHAHVTPLIWYYTQCHARFSRAFIAAVLSSYVLVLRSNYEVCQCPWFKVQVYSQSSDMLHGDPLPETIAVTSAYALVRARPAAPPDPTTRFLCGRGSACTATVGREGIDVMKHFCAIEVVLATLFASQLSLAGSYEVENERILIDLVQNNPGDPVGWQMTKYADPQVLASLNYTCLLYTSPSPRDATLSRMPSSA